MNAGIDLVSGGGLQMPAVGFGTYLIADDQAPELVDQAIGAGYRHIDTAEIYANEAGVGRGLHSAMRDQGLHREQLFVTTKLWPGHDAWGQPPKTYRMALDTLDQSLNKLSLDYVDLYLIHAPIQKAHRMEQWEALLEIKRQGKAKHIGVSNYGQAHVEEIRVAGLPLPAANQIELHPWSQKPELVSYLRSNDILIIAYSSLAPLSNWRGDQAQGSAKSEAMKAAAAAPDCAFKVMASKYGVSEAQLLLKWGLQQGYAVLPKSLHVDRIRQNIDLDGFTIDETDMDTLGAMDLGDGLAWGSGDPIHSP